MGSHTHGRPMNGDRIRFPRLERRQHWSGEGSAGSADGSAAQTVTRSLQGHTSSLAPCAETQGPSPERDVARHKQEMLRRSSGWTKTTPLGRHLSGGSHTRYHSRESLLPLQLGTTRAAKGHPKYVHSSREKQQPQSTCLTKTPDW